VLNVEVSRFDRFNRLRQEWRLGMQCPGGNSQGSSCLPHVFRPSPLLFSESTRAVCGGLSSPCTAYQPALWGLRSRCLRAPALEPDPPLRHRRCRCLALPQAPSSPLPTRSPLPTPQPLQAKLMRRSPTSSFALPFALLRPTISLLHSQKRPNLPPLPPAPTFPSLLASKEVRSGPPQLFFLLQSSGTNDIFAEDYQFLTFVFGGGDHEAWAGGCRRENLVRALGSDEKVQAAMILLLGVTSCGILAHVDVVWIPEIRIFKPEFLCCRRWQENRSVGEKF